MTKKEIQDKLRALASRVEELMTYEGNAEFLAHRLSSVRSEIQFLAQDVEDLPSFPSLDPDEAATVRDALTAFSRGELSPQDAEIMNKLEKMAQGQPIPSGLLADAVSCIESLADQQAMGDDFFEPVLERLRALMGDG